MKKYFTIFLLLLLCISCTATRKSGSLFNEDREKLDNFKVFNLTKEDLIRNFGEPSLELEDGTWLYYGYATKNLTFLKKNINSESILLVQFDDNDDIKNHLLVQRDNLKTILDPIKIDDGNDLWDIWRGLQFSPLTPTN